MNEIGIIAQNGGEWVDLLVLVIFIVIAGLGALIKKFQEKESTEEQQQAPRPGPQRSRIDLAAIQQRLIEQEQLRQQQARPVTAARPVKPVSEVSEVEFQRKKEKTAVHEREKQAEATRKIREKQKQAYHYELYGGGATIDLESLSHEELQRMIIFKEILDLPKSLRQEESY